MWWFVNGQAMAGDKGGSLLSRWQGVALTPVGPGASTQMQSRSKSRLLIDVPPAVFWVAVACVVGLQISLIASHDYFVDEWQALQIAVQSPDMAALLANLRYEGHPPLWYVLLRILAGLAGPAHALMAASLICALGTIVLITAFAPVSRWLRLALIVSEPLLFEFGTVSRGYSLGVTLVFAAMALWNKRRGFWCMLVLLPLVDFVFGIMAIGLIVLRAAERRHDRIWLPGAIAFVVTSAIAAWSVLPAADFVSVYRPTGSWEEVARWATQMGVVALPVQWDGGPLWNTPWRTPVTPLLGMLFLVMVFLQTRARPSETVVGVGFPLVLLAFMLAVHTLAIRHLMLSAVMFAAILWRQGAAGISPRIATRVWLAISAGCGLATAGFALSRPFDTAPQTANTIASLGLEGATWLSFPAQHAQGVSALSGIPFEGVELGCTSTFVRWNFRHKATDANKLREWLMREAATGGTFYLVSQHMPAPAQSIRSLGSIGPGLDGKGYHLFRIKGAVPGARSPRPPCVPGMRRLPRLIQD